MSKYIILALPNSEEKEFYTNNTVALTFFHTNTKYPNNEPYFSSLFNEYVIEKYAVSKEDLPRILKLAQGKSYACKRRNTKNYKIIVLKLNSLKLKALLNT